ncbi:hypothetical protein K439DRAFT_1612823 [Ramaria rubella]|nr:hypothetical protein K439DRAFT_1612823 [Ramaria rubella]
MPRHPGQLSVEEEQATSNVCGTLAKQARHTNEDHACNNDELAYQQAEQQEMDDDLDATLEQEELEQESGTWLGKRKCTNRIESEAEDDDNPLFPNLFEDIDDLYVSDSNEVDIPATQSTHAVPPSAPV